MCAASPEKPDCCNQRRLANKHNPPAAWHWAVGCGTALGVQVEQAPHLLAQAAATSDLLLATNGVLEQLPHLHKEQADTVRVFPADNKWFTTRNLCANSCQSSKLQAPLAQSRTF